MCVESEYWRGYSRVRASSYWHAYGCPPEPMFSQVMKQACPPIVCACADQREGGALPMAPVEKVYDIDLPVDEYWQLQLLPAWTRYTAFCANQVFELLSESEEPPDANGDVTCVRVTRLTAIENPVPSAFRGMLGSDTFSFKRTDFRLQPVLHHSKPSFQDRVFRL